jgi:hypothetical protein
MHSPENLWIPTNVGDEVEATPRSTPHVDNLTPANGDAFAREPLEMHPWLSVRRCDKARTDNGFEGI